MGAASTSVSGAPGVCGRIVGGQHASARREEVVRRDAETVDQSRDRDESEVALAPFYSRNHAPRELASFCERLLTESKLRSQAPDVLRDEL